MSTQGKISRRKSHPNNNILAQVTYPSKNQNITITEIISEGEIAGLAEGGSSIFVNGDPLFDIGEAPFVPPESVTAAGATNSTSVTTSASTAQIYDSDDGNLFLAVADIIETTVTLSSKSYFIQGVAEATAGLRATMTATDTPFLENMEHAATLNGNMWAENIAHGDAILELFLDSGEKLWGFIPVDGFTNTNTAVFASNRITDIDGYLATSDFANNNSHKLKITLLYKVAGISGTTVTLDSAPTVAFTGKNFYFQGAILANAYEYNKKYPNSAYEFRTGTLTQLPISGINGEGTTSISLNVPGGNLEKDTAQTITSDALTGGQKREVDRVDFIISYASGLYAYDESNGKDENMGVGYRVEVGISRGSGFTYTSAGGNVGPSQRSPSIGTSTETLAGHSGIFKTATSFEFGLDLTPFQPFTDFAIRITRLTNHDNRPNNPLGRGNGSGTGKDGGSLAPFKNELKWKHVSNAVITSASATITERLNYPHTALASISFNSKQFSNVPRRSYEVKGLKVLVPSNYITRDENGTQEALYKRNVSTGAVTGTVQAWDGNFRAQKVYTNNPAWVFYDILTNNRYGLGSYLSSLDIDKYALYKIGKYCDELVPDGKGGTEPRFTSNLYFQKATDAYKVLKDVATIFRGMLYWMDGSISPVMDEAKEPVYQFSKSNVIDGAFQYESTGSKTRANQYIISWNNPASNYKLEPLIVEDRRNIIDTRKIIKESAVAFGCTSEGQAIRYGRWKLWTAINQTEIVSFETGINASFLAPGDIINISDSDDFNIPFSGRVQSYTESGGNFLTLDRNIDSLLPTTGYTYTVSVIIPKNVAVLNQDSATIGGGAALSRGDIVTTARVASGGSQTTLVVASEATTQLNISNALDDSNNPIDLILNTSTIVQEKDLTGSTTIDGVANQVPAVAVDGRTKLQLLSALDEGNASDLSEAIWAVRQTANADGVDTLSSPKEYKILGIAESDGEGTFAITAVEHYNEKFDSIEEDFKLSIVDPVYPPEPRQTPPRPKNLRILRVPVPTERGEEIRVQWDNPDNYDHLQQFLVTHNCTNNFSFVETIVTGNHLVLTNLRDSTYTIKVQAISRLGKKSRPISQNIQIVDIFGGSATRFNGILIGGVCSSALDINTTTGNVSFLKSSYAITPPQTPAGNISDGSAEAAVRSNNTSNASSKSQSVTALANNSWPGYKTDDDVTEGRLFYDFSNVDHGSNDPIRLIAWKRDATLDIEYWFDADKYIADANSVWVNQSGTVAIAAGSNKVVGTNTSFTSLEVTRILKFSSTQAAKIAFIESDTVLYLDRSFTGAVNAGTTAQADELAIDFSEDFILGSVTYNPNVSAGDRYKLKPNIVKNDTLVDNSRSVIVTPNLTSLIYDVSGAIKTKFSDDNINLKIQTVGFESPQISVTGAGFAQTDQSEDTGFASISSEPHTEVLHSATNTGANPPPYTYSGTAGLPLVFTVTIREEENTSITSTETITISKAQEAAGGGGSGIVYLYKSSVNTPSINTTTGTDEFPDLVIALTGNSAGQITGVSGSGSISSNQIMDVSNAGTGWYTVPQSPAAATHTVWITAATAANTGATDTILNTEWATPVKFSGADGAAGINSATIEVFKLSTSGSGATTAPTDTLTYTFNDGEGDFSSDSSDVTVSNGWNLVAPTPNNTTKYLYKRTASAIANTATDTIPTSEWSPAILIAQLSEDGISTNFAFIRVPHGTSSGDVTASTDGTSVTPANFTISGTTYTWSDTIPAGGGTLYTTKGTKASGAAGFTWGTPRQLEGDNHAELIIYSDIVASGGSAPADPTACTYNFTTGALTIAGTNASSWNKTPPTLAGAADGSQIFAITVLVSGAPGDTSTAIANTAWSAPFVHALHEKGDQGPAGVASKVISIYKLAATDSAAASFPDNGQTPQAFTGTAGTILFSSGAITWENTAEPPPSNAESVFAVFATSTEPFATADNPVPPSATAKSVIPVIEPPVIATLESSRCATSVATAYPVPPVFTVVVGAACKFLNSFHFWSPASRKKPAYSSCEPESSYNP